MLPHLLVWGLFLALEGLCDADFTYRESWYVETADHYLRGHSLANVSGVARYQRCLVLCLRRQFECRSVNYYDQLLLCQMNDAVKEDFGADFIQSSNVSYFDENQVTASIESSDTKPEPCNNPVRLGLEDGSIPDENITASSVYTARDISTPARGRLNKPDVDGTTVGAWAPSVANTNQWIQVDLGKATFVHGVLMQGRDDHGNQWVTKYSVQYRSSPQAAARDDVLDDSNQVQVFDGNTNAHDVVTSLFGHPILASTVRINPVEWSGYISLRFELLGCK